MRRILDCKLCRAVALGRDGPHIAARGRADRTVMTGVPNMTVSRTPLKFSACESTIC